MANKALHHGVVAALIAAMTAGAACGKEGAAGDTAGAPATVGGGGTTGAGGTTSNEGAACPKSGAVSAPDLRPDSVVFAPNVTVATVAGGAAPGAQDGAMAAATFANPVSIIFGPAGTLFVCDFDNDRIRRIDLGSSVVATLTTRIGFQRPFGFGYGPDGTLYVDTDVNPSGVKTNLTGTIWRVDVATGAVTVVAANLGRPRGIVGLPDGRLVLTDYQNARLRLLDPATSAVSELAGLSGCPGFADGRGDAARFAGPYAVVRRPEGDLVVADSDNHVLRRVTMDGTVSPFAGDGGSGTIDGATLQARFIRPNALAMDALGNIYVSDAGAARIRRVGADGTVTTIAGDGIEGFQDGAGPQAEFFGQEGIVLSADGATLYVADGTGGDPAAPYNRIRKITIGP